MSCLVVATGGTGGHIFPALAVAEAARKLVPGLRVVFAGAGEPEQSLAERAGLEFARIPSRGVLGKGLAAKLGSVWILKGLWMSFRLFAKIKPDVVAGFGGFAGFCPPLAARLMGIPSALHEQNSVPGAANRQLARFVARIFAAYPDGKGYFPAAKLTQTGNPIRPEIAALAASERPVRLNSRNLLVLGGSQGARAVNQALLAAWPKLYAAGVNLWHQSGKQDFEATQAAYAACGVPAPKLTAFIDDMAEAYAWADLAVARAGASSLAEIAAAGLPSILIPFPHATHNHQELNARHLEAGGAAQVILQDAADQPDLAESVLKLFGSPEKLGRMGRAARSLAKPEAALSIAQELAGMAKWPGALPLDPAERRMPAAAGGNDSPRTSSTGSNAVGCECASGQSMSCATTSRVFSGEERGFLSPPSAPFLSTKRRLS